MNLILKLKLTGMYRSEYSQKLFNVFLCFLTYSFFGWVIETIYMSVYHGYLTKRGFLISPVCSVYGFASVFIVYLLNYFKNRPALLFFGAAFVTTFMELIAGLFLKNIFNKKLWDYSKEPANFMGYISLKNTIIWSILAMIVVYLVHPAVIRFMANFPFRAKELFCCITIITLFVDFSISVYSNLQGMNSFAWLSQVIAHRIR